MSIAVPVVLLSRRLDVADALERDPGATRYVLSRFDPAIGESLERFAAAIVDAPSLDDANALVRKLQRTHAALELLVIVTDERAGVDAIRNGAFDFLLWPPTEPAALWTALGRLVERAVAPRSGTPASIGGYKILERLGSGGMAEVFLAQKPGDDPLVLKVMRPEIAEEERYVAMFLEEAHISQVLSHPNLVRVYDAGGTTDELYLVMEHVRGQNLGEIGKRAGWRFPPRLACWVAAEVAAALEHAHTVVDRSGARVALIHRDVNPPNVLVREDGAVKLTDFGIAKTKHHHSRTTQGVLRGKLDYMSPEQVDAQPLDARTDVFSLGAVLYVMLTGQHPFSGTTTLQILQRISAARCDPPSSIEPSIPASLEAIVMKALARDRDERYGSAKAFESDLRAWIAKEGTRAIGKGDLAAFVADAASARAGVIPGGDRGRETRVPGMATALSPARPAPVPPHAEQTIGRSTGRMPRDPAREPTVGREPLDPSRERTIGRAEPTVTSASAPPVPFAPPASPSVTASIPAYSKETADSRGDSALLAGRREGDHDTVERPAPVAPRADAPLATPPWKTPAAIGAGALAVVLLLALAFGLPGGGETATVRAPATTTTPIAIATTPSIAEAPRASVVPSRTPLPVPSRTAAAPSPVPSPTMRVAIATQPPVTPRASPAPLRKGTVSIWVTDGWAAVSVDGKSLGLNAPVIGLELAEGKHRVTLENAPLKVRRDYDVTVVAGEDTKLKVSIRSGS